MRVTKRALVVSLAICSIAIFALLGVFSFGWGLSTPPFRAQTLIVFSHGAQLRVGTTALVDSGNGRYSAQPSTDTTVWVFRDFDGLGSDTVRRLQENGVKIGTAYLRRGEDTWKPLKDVDLRLKDDQIASEFGI